MGQYSWGELSHGLTELQEDVIADNIESLDLEIINRIQTRFSVLVVVVGSDFMNITKLMQYGANLNNNGDDLKQIGGARASCTYM
jgi:hypothetical protein